MTGTEPQSTESNRHTITVQIGNTDNRLTQQEWADFHDAVNHAVHFACTHAGYQIHFSGCAESWRPWQNAAWVFDHGADLAPLNELVDKLAELAGKHRQDSIAWTVGTTSFLTTAGIGS